jgi:Mab-21 protein
MLTDQTFYCAIRADSNIYLYTARGLRAVSFTQKLSLLDIKPMTPGDVLFFLYRSSTSMEQLISDFLCNTCYVHPKPNIQKFNALHYCINVAVRRVNDGNYSWIATSSGSASEFYIEPMLSCIDDYDVMRHLHDLLAIPEGHQVPRCLPSEFHQRVKLFELIETKFPCYVLVKQVGELIKCDNEDNYSHFSPTEDNVYLSTTQLEDDTQQHGPAALQLHQCPAIRKYIINDRDLMRMSVDAVFCIRCLVWPPQAAEWATRRRKYDWPDMTTVDLIVNNGCDVVQITHPQCRQNELARKYTWRLSFSRAETVLLNTWSVKQQIVYHVLRIFMKTIRSKYDLNDSICNYHIKTLMLWACELDSPMTWNSCNAISVCKRLIRRLAKCVESFKCVSYFDRHVNLLNNCDETEQNHSLVSRLFSFTSESFDLLLIDNYIRQCTTQCPAFISRVFPDDLNLEKLSYVMSAMIQWRQSCQNEISYENFRQASTELQRLIFVRLTPDNNHLHKFVIEQLNVADSRLVPLFFAACFLKIASILDRGLSSSQLADTLRILIQVGGLSFSHNATTLPGRLEVGNNKRISLASSSGMRTFTVCKYFETACLIMQAARLSFNTTKSHSIGPLFAELSTFYLHFALKCNGAECRDFHARSRSLLNVYLACLFCGSKRGELAFAQSSTEIAISHKFRGAFCHIERRFLPCFDERVETLLGLIVFYSFLRQIFVGCSYQDMQLDVFTADLLAYYLEILCADIHCSHLSCRSKFEIFGKYQTCLLNKKILTTVDVLVFHDMCRRTNFSGAHKTQLASIYHTCFRCSRRVNLQLVNFNSSKLSELLVELAVENLTDFRLSMSRDFSYVCQIVTSDFQAMYAYKFGLYELCLSLCENNVVSLLQGSAIKPNVMMVEESDLLDLMDDESLSLIGLAKLCGVFDINPDKGETVSQLTFSVYLLVQCKLRLKHPPATFIETLRIVKTICFCYSGIINPALMMLAYCKAIQHLR